MIQQIIDHTILLILTALPQNIRRSAVNYREQHVSVISLLLLRRPNESDSLQFEESPSREYCWVPV